MNLRRRLPIVLLTLLVMLSAGLARLAAQGATTINIPGVGRVTVNPDGTINLPGGGTATLNANGTVTLPNGTVVTVPTGPAAGGGGGGGALPVATDPRIVATAGILTGDDATAAVVVPASGGGGAGGLLAPNATYLWTITGGRFTSTDLTRATVNYTADAAGTAKLTCVVTVTGSAAVTVTTEVTVIDPVSAGAITTGANLSAATTATGVASVPAAQNADRTFRWTVTGTAARLSGGGTTNQITFVPGDPGVKELTCEVTFTAVRVTVTLRSFVVVLGSGPTVPLAVNGGYGGGNYPGGSRLDIFAATPPAGQVFDRWTGDTAVLGTGALAPFLSHPLITLPNTPVTLTATYKAAPAWTPLTVTAFNSQTFTPGGANATPVTASTTLAYYLPPGATAVVFLLHDTGGAAAGWFTAPESALLLRELVAAGYGVAALSSVNRNAGTWNAQTTLAANPDALNLVAALNKFSTEGLLPASRPVFLLGLADGADAAVRYADLLRTATPARSVLGTVLYCAAGVETSAVVSPVPALYLLADNDSALAATGVTAARRNSALLAGRGLASAVINNTAAPVHAGRFRALGVTNPAFTATDATAVWTAVKTAGLIDGNNYVKAIPSDGALTAAVPAAYQSRRADIAAQLNVAYAEQAFFSDANARVVAWIGARIAATPAPAAGRLTNLSTRLKLSAADDSLTFGFTLTGSERATLLVRGIGPGLAAFGVPGTIASPRLEIRAAGANQPLLAGNQGWDRAPNNATAIEAAAASVGGFALVRGSADAAVLVTLNPGGYTVTFNGVNGVTGEILAEVYDVTKNSTRISNLATLARLSNPGDLVTAGITVAGNTRTLVVRGVGPGLGDLGVPNTLPDPTITVLPSGSTTSVAANNNWSTGGSQAALAAAFPAVGAFGLKTTSADAALVYPFAAGGYSIQTGAAAVPANQPNPPATTGVLIIEVYEAP